MSLVFWHHYINHYTHWYRRKNCTHYLRYLTYLRNIIHDNWLKRFFRNTIINDNWNGYIPISTMHDFIVSTIIYDFCRIRSTSIIVSTIICAFDIMIFDLSKLPLSVISDSSAISVLLSFWRPESTFLASVLLHLSILIVSSPPVKPCCDWFGASEKQ